MHINPHPEFLLQHLWIQGTEEVYQCSCRHHHIYPGKKTSRDEYRTAEPEQTKPAQTISSSSLLTASSLLWCQTRLFLRATSLSAVSLRASCPATTTLHCFVSCVWTPQIQRNATATGNGTSQPRETSPGVTVTKAGTVEEQIMQQQRCKSCPCNSLTFIFVGLVLNEVLEQIFGHGQRTPRSDFLYCIDPVKTGISSVLNTAAGTDSHRPSNRLDEPRTAFTQPVIPQRSA